MSTPVITPAMAGTWLDGCHGWHNTYRVVDRAVAYGFVVPEEYAADLEAYRSDTYEHDAHAINVNEAVNGQGGLADQATEFLDEHAPDGYVFVWDAGELSMVTVQADCAMSGGACTEDNVCPEHAEDNE